MVRLVLTDEQSRLVRDTDDVIEVFDVRGRRLGTLPQRGGNTGRSEGSGALPFGLTDEDIHKAKEAASSGGPTYTLAEAWEMIHAKYDGE